MRILLIIGLFVIGSQAQAQSLAEATTLFDRFEYAKAADVYSQLAQKKSLSQEDYKKMAYSYYAIGAYSKCFPLVDSLIGMNEIEPFFFYMHGMSAMATEQYATAKQSFQKYQSLDNEFPVSVLIVSCDSIPTWQDVKFKQNELAAGNHSKADFSGSKYKEDYIRFQEVGRDSMNQELAIENIDLAELILSRPMVRNSEGQSNFFILDPSFENAAITSLAVFQPSNEVLVTISQPLAKKEEHKAPHLYIGKLDSETNTISDLVLWDLSGQSDSAFCAHATINASSNVIVFTKISATTKGSDLYWSNLENGSWTNPKPIESINTEFDEVFPMFSGDSILTFSSNGRLGYGGLDIFSSKVNGTQFETIDHLHAPINSFGDDFNYVYLSEENAIFTSNRIGGTGDDDIYQITYTIDKVDPDQVAYNEFVASWIDLKVYFEFAKYEFNHDLKKLADIVKFMEKYPTLTLTIEGHTDSRGTEEYNENLGYFRAEVIKKEFISRGVKADQIKIVSKGKSDPQQLCEKGCSESEHALNRVSVVKLVVPQ